MALKYCHWLPKQDDHTPWITENRSRKKEITKLKKHSKASNFNSKDIAAFSRSAKEFLSTTLPHANQQNHTVLCRTYTGHSLSTLLIIPSSAFWEAVRSSTDSAPFLSLVLPSGTISLSLCLYKMPSSHNGRRTYILSFLLMFPTVQLVLSKSVCGMYTKCVCSRWKQGEWGMSMRNFYNYCEHLLCHLLLLVSEACSASLAASSLWDMYKSFPAALALRQPYGLAVCKTPTY